MFTPFKKFTKKALLPYHYLYAKEQPKSYITEAYQKFLVNLEYINIDGHYNSFQITSSVSAEGKTTFIGNIAYLLAKKEEKVIVIDLDLRKPKMHRLLEVANENGIAEYLSGKISLDQAIIKHPYGFDAMVRGENTSAIINVLTSDKLKALILVLKERYDYILVDSPPVILVSDALYIAQLVDATVFAIAQSETNRSIVKDAVSLLRQNNVNLIGTVLLQVDLKAARYGYGYGYNYDYDEEDDVS